MTREELVTKFASYLQDLGVGRTKSEILRDVHSWNNIECKIGNPEWYMLSLRKLRRMVLKISEDLELSLSEIYLMSKENILEMLFSLDVMFQCYTYTYSTSSFESRLPYGRGGLINEPEIQKKFIYLGATMGKDFSFLLNMNSITVCTSIENLHFGKFTDMSNLTKYALAYENFENENKYEQMLKQLRRRQIFQEQQLQEIRREIYASQIQFNNEIDPTGGARRAYSDHTLRVGPYLLSNEHKINILQKLKSFPKWLTHWKRTFKNKEFIIDASCSVCYISKKNILFTDCGHVSACSACSDKLGFKCPLCRKISDNKMIVFY